MADIIQVTAEKIRTLQVKGARNVAIAAIEALQILATQTQAQTKTQFLNELREAQSIFATARETEPLMRNALRGIINQTQTIPAQNIQDLCENLTTSTDKFLKDLETSREQTAEIGAKRIQDGMVVFTHCHSSTVTRLLAKAKEQNKTFQVICTETRPIFQGRITAKELIDLDIETTFIVDSAVRPYIAKADLVVVGADAITSEGNIVNKIGTGNIAVLAQEARKPFYVVSELLKFDPETLSGTYEKIEHRNPDEIWSEAPPKLKVCNPAFDITPNRYIHGLICEEGIVPPQTILEIVRRKYPWIF
ncbi:S-methyl-5-thioribose-1-phosphate isomerase [Candidatus Bathycorpusculum sp.]|jgi:ribose 1,5-bisphosphate isomerase|uniref:translation initiation factor eIF-2B n=1 Tax=Candidatus Bathycorpusculum sp. TaxID=2994959 RepID=UPI00282A379F|nr:S-methyl-5-thioribose-1-phosphate isomerase [Candidatus Termitimicrobium sp.]MCL2686519.1 S-methyl-5-thioribose-1-phosphate isomerase [Candidatus Termitimicrobium sp.]